MPRFTEHTARLAAEQIAHGKPLSEIDETELSSLEALVRSEIWDRRYRHGASVTITSADVPFRTF